MWGINMDELPTRWAKTTWSQRCYVVSVEEVRRKSHSDGLFACHWRTRGGFRPSRRQQAVSSLNLDTEVSLGPSGITNSGITRGRSQVVLPCSVNTCLARRIEAFHGTGRWCLEQRSSSAFLIAWNLCPECLLHHECVPQQFTAIYAVYLVNQLNCDTKRSQLPLAGRHGFKLPF